MLRARSDLRSASSFITNQPNECRPIPSSLSFYSSRSRFHPIFHNCIYKKKSVLVIRCNANYKSDASNDSADSDHDYLQASVLFSETSKHYRLLMRGFQDETRWQSSRRRLFPFSAKSKDPIRLGFYRQFQSPTIFLKSSCDGDYLLPIIVGEFAVKKLIDSETEEESLGCPNQYQFVGDLVEKLGYQVVMVRITERILNTYFARIVFCKPGENGILSVDARPSDAINVANRCKAPIYINKRILLTDGIRISFALGRALTPKSAYDVVLDSATDGPDILAEELEIVQNMNLAVGEERYEDAAKWREKLMKLRDSLHGDL